MGFNLPLLNLRRRLLGSGVSFSPVELFTLSEPGLWLDPSDVANLDWRRNLLTWTEQFDNAVWTKTGLTVSGNQISYAGGSGLTRECVQLVTIPGGTANKVLTAYVTVSGSGKFRLKNTHSAVQDNFSANITATGTRQTVTLTVTNSASAGNGLQAISIITSTDDAAFSLTVHEFQLELGSTATAYQRITDVNTEVIERFPSATLYQDTAGTAPVTTPGQSVALALDKSKGLVLGSELVTNGTFDSGLTGFTQTSGNVGTSSVIAGELNVVAGAGGSGGFYQDITVVQGATYLLTVKGRRIAGSGSVRFQAYDGAAFTTLIRQFFDITTTGPQATYSAYVRATSTTTIRVYLYADTSTTGGFDDVSLKLLSGNHATQATAGSRPIYGIVPVGGRRNLLTWSEDFRDTAAAGNTRPWVRTAANITPDAGVAPDGTTTADKIIATSVSGNHFVSQSFVMGAAPHTVSCYMKAAEYTTGSIFLSQSGNVGAVFTLSGSGSYVVTGTGNTASISSVGNGWYRCVVTNNGSSDLFDAIRVGPADGAINIFTGNDTSGILIWGAQLELGSTATAYQRVTDQYDVTEAGVASASYLQFDTSKFLVTPTIDPSTGPVTGAELVSNGDFSSGGTGWTFTGMSVVNGAAQGSGDGLIADQLISVVAGRFYEIKYTASVTGSATSVFIRLAAGGNLNTQTVTTTPVAVTVRLQAPAGADRIRLINSGSTTDLRLDNISVREVVADKVQAFAGVRKLSDSALGVVFESSVDISTNNGAVWLTAPRSNAAATYSWRSKGTVIADATSPASFAAPITNVLTGIGDIAGDNATLRINGAQVAQVTTDQGTGNYLAYPLYIGARGPIASPSLPLNGQIFSLIVRFGANLTADQITSTEIWAGGKTGFFTPVISGQPTVGVS